MKYYNKNSLPEENEFEDTYNQNDGFSTNNRKRYLMAFIALIILLTFIVWSFPQIGLLFSDFTFLQQNQQLHDEEIVKNNLPAIVSVEVKGEANQNKRGTGFNIAEEGLILTNFHVVENCQSIKIVFPDGQYFFSVDYKQIGNADIAIIRLDGKELPYISLELDERIKPGELTTVIGNPLGYKHVSVQGNAVSYHSFNNYEIFEISVPIKKGSSGSPVFNSNGNAAGLVFGHRDLELDGKTYYRALAIPLQDFAFDIKNELTD